MKLQAQQKKKREILLNLNKIYLLVTKKHETPTISQGTKFHKIIIFTNTQNMKSRKIYFYKKKRENFSQNEKLFSRLKSK